MGRRSRPSNSCTEFASAVFCSTRRSNWITLQPTMTSGSWSANQALRRSIISRRVEQYTSLKFISGTAGADVGAGASPSMKTTLSPAPSSAMEYRSSVALVSISSDTTFNTGRQPDAGFNLPSMMVEPSRWPPSTKTPAVMNRSIR